MPLELFNPNRWRSRCASGCKTVLPTLKQMDLKRHRLRENPEKASVWSGAVVDAPAGSTIRVVHAVWTVPECDLPADAKERIRYAASSWVGIDGDHGSTDILQAGVDSEVWIEDGAVKRDFRVWWEWAPEHITPTNTGPSNWVSNFPVKAGDVLDIVIFMNEKSDTQATVQLNNRTTGVVVTCEATAPPDTHLKGNCAEWIVERIWLGSDTPELACYGELQFNDAKAFTDADQALVSSDTSEDWDAVDMVDDGMTIPISRGNYVVPDVVQCKYAGPVPAARKAGA